jgi:hypothetical protein
MFYCFDNVIMFRYDWEQQQALGARLSTGTRLEGEVLFGTHPHSSLGSPLSGSKSDDDSKVEMCGT